MEVTKVIGIGIIGVFLCSLVKNYRPELGVGVALAVGTVIFAMSMPAFSEAVFAIYEICESSPVLSEYIKTIVKITGIAYITQFSAELAKDAGEGAVAKKLEFAGKTAILVLMLPIVKNLLEVLTDTLMSF